MHQQSNQPRRWRRLALASTLAGLALVGGLAGATPASAAAANVTPAGATVAPAVNETKCSPGSSSDNVVTCIDVEDVGNTFTATGSADVISSARDLQVCVNTPAVTRCGPPQGFVNVTPQDPPLTVIITGLPQSSGSYCANTWRRNADGSKTEIAHVCVTE